MEEILTVMLGSNEPDVDKILRHGRKRKKQQIKKQYFYIYKIDIIIFISVTLETLFFFFKDSILCLQILINLVF